jgi:UDP-glucuronate decarboxylase
MRYLITGGAGFIGSHLCETLLDLGNSVTCVDDFSSSSLYSEVDRLKKRKNYKFFHHNVQEPFFFECDRIFHLACPASPMHYQRDPINTLRTCFEGTINALKCSSKYNARLLITSTSEIYGDPEVNPQPETYFGNVNTSGPRSCYDEGKRISETLAYSWSQVNNNQVRIARLFNTYGTYLGPHDGRFLPNIISQALHDKDLTIYGDGNQTRSFCYVTDTIRGLIALMNYEGEEQFPIFNIGNPDERSIMSVANMVIQLTSSNSKIINLPSLPDDPMRRRPDVRKAKEYLEWEPQIGLYEGLQNTIRWYKSRL